MSQDKAESTCCAAGEHSKPWTELVSLGELIVDELGLNTSTDTLSRWMAHRLAELIQEADQGDESARREAAELIMKLWVRRSAWPTGWPPPKTAEAIRGLTPSADARRSREPEPAHPWLTRLDALDGTHEAERAIWLRLALGELDLDDEIAAAQAQHSNLNDDERLLFATLEVRCREATEYFAEKLEEDGPLARARLAKNELADTAQHRSELFDAAEKDSLELGQSAG